MPYTASSARGLPAAQAPGADAHDPAHDGASPSTATVCRHLLGDVFRVPDSAAATGPCGTALAS